MHVAKYIKDTFDEGQEFSKRPSIACADGFRVEIFANVKIYHCEPQ
jgi:hypothetical protein